MTKSIKEKNRQQKIKEYISSGLPIDEDMLKIKYKFNFIYTESFLPEEKKYPFKSIMTNKKINSSKIKKEHIKNYCKIISNNNINKQIYELLCRYLSLTKKHEFNVELVYIFVKITNEKTNEISEYIYISFNVYEKKHFIGRIKMFMDGHESSEYPYILNHQNEYLDNANLALSLLKIDQPSIDFIRNYEIKDNYRKPYIDSAKTIIYEPENIKRIDISNSSIILMMKNILLDPFYRKLTTQFEYFHLEFYLSKDGINWKLIILGPYENDCRTDFIPISSFNQLGFLKVMIDYAYPTIGLDETDYIEENLENIKNFILLNDY